MNKSSFQRAPFWGSCIERYYVQVSSSGAHLELLLWVKPVESATEENHAGALLHTVRTRVCAYKAHVWIQSFTLQYLSITMLESPPLHFNGFKTLCLEVFWRTSFFIVLGAKCQFSQSTVCTLQAHWHISSFTAPELLSLSVFLTRWRANGPAPPQQAWCVSWSQAMGEKQWGAEAKLTALPAVCIVHTIITSSHQSSLSELQVTPQCELRTQKNRKAVFQPPADIALCTSANALETPGISCAALNALAEDRRCREKRPWESWQRLASVCLWITHGHAFRQEGVNSSSCVCERD